ncbi:isocitrate/isopropylmalate family dehydrogenase [Actinoplanes sp. HUAS TT8]|uniref:isocitrate/isopropylmalate family dehydrogenase n=1 Tax=Actinoplanes sp. HUAS TT8 TaxID=3447453 RepID=UPI003F52729C
MSSPYTLGVLHGDGIGPEIVPAAVRVIDDAMRILSRPPIDWVELPMGASAIASHGAALPEGTLDTLAVMDAMSADEGADGVGHRHRDRAPDHQA